MPRYSPAKFKRKSGIRSYNRLVIYIPEGRLTEESYFMVLRDNGLLADDISISLGRSASGDITHLIKTAKEVESELKNPQDAIWILCDRDTNSHTAEDFVKLTDWRKKKESRHLAVSNPRFEYWLLLHFCQKVSPYHAESDSHVAKYIKGFDSKKSVAQAKSKFTITSVLKAVERAKANTAHTYSPWTQHGSSVFALVEAILKKSDQKV